MKTLRYAWSLGVCLFLAATLQGCATGKLLGFGLYGDSFEPKPGQNTIEGDSLSVVLNRVRNGSASTDFFVDITVKNVGGADVAFDPGEIELTVLDTGLTFFHVTKNATVVKAPEGLNVLLPLQLRPGQATQGSLWYKTGSGKADAQSIEIVYKGKKLRYPPGN